MNKTGYQLFREAKGFLCLCAAEVKAFVFIKSLDIKPERLTVIHTESLFIDIKGEEIIVIPCFFEKEIIFFKLILNIVRMDREGSVRIGKGEKAAL